MIQQEYLLYLFLLECEVVIMKKRVAAYCRISSNSKEQQTSGDAQVMYYINLLYNNDDYIVIGIFYDVGSGLRTKNRKNYLKLKNIIENNGIDILFCKFCGTFFV